MFHIGSPHPLMKRKNDLQHVLEEKYIARHNHEKFSLQPDIIFALHKHLVGFIAGDADFSRFESTLFVTTAGRIGSTIEGNANCIFPAAGSCSSSSSVKEFSHSGVIFNAIFCVRFVAIVFFLKNLITRFET
jgi:hypothetical protein